MLATEAGRIAWRAQLDVYGVPREEDGVAAADERTANPWRFPGQYEDAETELYYNRFRYYDPELGRYLSEDPIAFAGGMALYAYVAASAAQVDPFGLSCAEDELKDIGALKGRSKAEIEASLSARGFSTTPAHSGGTILLKPMPDGTTAAVRLDPPKVRTPANGWADEVAHAHKETVPTSKVNSGNYKPKHASSLNDAGSASLDPTDTHIPIQW